MSKILTSVENFIKQHRVQEYTYFELSRIFNDMGFAIVDIHSPISVKYLAVLGTGAIDNDKCFLCHCCGIKAVFIDTNQIDEIKCFELSSLVPLIESSDSRSCDKKSIFEGYMFASKLRELLETPETQTKRFALIQKIGLAIICTVIALFSAIIGIIYFKGDNNEKYVSSFKMVSQHENSLGNNETPVFNIISSEDVDDNKENNATDDVDVSDSLLQPQNEQDEIVYYATKSGTKYHIKGCQYLKDLSSCTVFTKEELMASSLTPCKKCIK